MPFIDIYVHFVWATKNRVPFLENGALRREVWRHIHSHGREQGIHVDFVGGWVEHCHCLVSLRNTDAADDVMRILEGESSHFVNRSGMCREGFEWQDGYFAAAVEHGRVRQVRDYIRNQEAHHAVVAFEEEYCRLLLESGHSGVVTDFR